MADQDGDIPVQIPPVTGSGSSETFTIKAGAKSLPVNTGGKNLRIIVKSGKNTFSVPVDKRDWDLRIVEDK